MPIRRGTSLARIGVPLILVAACFLHSPSASPAQPAGNDSHRPDPAALAFFESQVRPLLEARCLKCHGREPKIRGNLRLDSREAVLRGGDLGPAVSLDAPEESLFLQAIRYEGPEMPPSGKLPQAEIDVLTRWVRQGLPWPAGGRKASENREPTPEPPVPSRPPGPSAWLYRIVVRPTVPTVKVRSWPRNPIDAFILAGLESHRLGPNGPADRVALIRRATYDLTGLPPAPEEVDAFASDPSPDAYERLVDRLLASPHYGETWGRHWLDLVRYAETNGYERDSAKPYAWRYRDYVIDSFNRDKPYDRFLHEQLAGDEIAPDSAEAWIATGFYRLGIWDDEPADRPLARYDVLDGVVSTAGQVFLGLSIHCARCHEHKKDPIPQADYYRLLAFFNDVTNQDGKNTRKVGPDALEVMCVREQGKAETHVLLRGNPNLHGPRVEPGVPAIVGDGAATFTPGPGKRRALAEWLTDRRNPMTARVLVNRLWQYHFGRGIVPTPNDFGGLGEPPTHPELLDWLAAELMDGGWRIKRMHRLILLSNTYRMSSRANPRGLAKDPGNQHFWRYPMRRLRAEEVRDAILAVSGTLNPKAGGPSIRPPIPREVLAGQSIPGNGWSVSPPDESARRSVYIHVKRALLVPILAAHDSADTDSSCPVRYTTTVPAQPLGLLNGQFANEQAELFAGRLLRERPGDLAGQIRRAIRLTTGADPPAEEVAADVAWLRSVRAGSGLSEHDAMTQYCLMALNASAFLYLD
jgi:hypothetical protein